MFLSKVQGLCCNCQNVEMPKCRNIPVIIPPCVKNPVMGVSWVKYDVKVEVKVKGLWGYVVMWIAKIHKYPVCSKF